MAVIIKTQKLSTTLPLSSCSQCHCRGPTKPDWLICTKRKHPKVKERLLLVIRVREDGQVPFRVVKEMHRSNPWASDWLKRYDEEGTVGLKDRDRSGRPPNC